MRKPIDPEVLAKRAAETEMVEALSAKVYNRQLLASCGQIADDETARSRGKICQGTVRLAMEEAGLIERQPTPEPTKIVDRDGLIRLLKEMRDGPSQS